MIHLYSHGYEGDDLMDFTLRLSNPSSIAQQQKLELIKSKFEIAGTAPEGLVSRRWIRKNILELTDQEIESIKLEREKDKREDTRIEAVGSEQESSDSDSGDMGSDTGTDTGGGEESGGETGGGDIESLFAGDVPRGKLLTAAPRASRGEDYTDDEDLPEDSDDIFINLSIGDEKAPVRISNHIDRVSKDLDKKLDMWGRPMPKKRKSQRGPLSNQMPDFRKTLGGLGNTQSPLRTPTGIENMSGLGLGSKGLGETSSKKESPVSDFIDRKMSQRKSMTHDIKRVLDKYSSTVKNDKPLILKEADDNDPIEIDLKSLRRKASDE
jgi:hypothetical protein